MADLPIGTTKEGTEAPKAAGGVFGIELPTDLTIWTEARKLIGDSNLRVDDIATCCLQDPAIIIELIKISNALYFSGGRSPITTARTAIIRLGSDVVLDTFTKLHERKQIESPRVSHWFELHRSRCKRTAIIARLLSELLAKNLADDTQAIALLFSTGDLVATMFFGETYADIADDVGKSSIAFRLLQSKKFDIEKNGLNYLRRIGIPEQMVSIIDREATIKSTERAIMKPICFAAAEIVEAFDSNKWEKISPGKTLPPKSALRSLGMNDSSYLKIYERASEYLFAARLQEERKKIAGGMGENPSAEQIEKDGIKEDLDSEIAVLINSSSQAPVVEKSPKTEVRPETILQEIKSDLPFTPTTFGLDNPSNDTGNKVPRVEPSSEKLEAPSLLSKKNNEFLGKLTAVMDQATSSEDLLKQILGMLVNDGTFEKAALIVTSHDRKQAIVVTARGPGIGDGQRILLDDPLSPLAQCFSKIRSYSTRDNQCSPWGSRSFAVAPLNVDHETPVALYADCGVSGTIKFEGRRLFRTVVELLNQKLPELPGGIPVEVKL